MLLGGIWMLQQINTGQIQPLFQATPLPTRSVDSYLMEGDAYFSAGNVNKAITSYQEAGRANPNDAQLWAELARIQTYSSAFLITNPDKKARLLEALDSANKAVELAPEDSKVRAIRAFVLDWNASGNFYASDQVQKYLIEAEQQALIALQLESSNTLALAYYAEILIDQQKWNQAELYMQQALARPDADQLMDVHRINAYFLVNTTWLSPNMKKQLRLNLTLPFYICVQVRTIGALRLKYKTRMPRFPSMKSLWSILTGLWISTNKLA
jgi:tetratricopeptide (TPR) repeat protein